MKEKNLLLIFTRNPELGKCKTRLAATIGDQAALDIYKFLLQHTVEITKNLDVHKEVHYSVKIRDNDSWNPEIYTKKQQVGDDLGQRMEYAFAAGFANGYQNIIIIGSDLYDVTQKDIENAFLALASHEYVIGPAEDGGYYLFGMKSLNSQVFKNKTWGTETVLKDTLKNIQNENLKLLEERNDIDYYEDIKDIAVFQKFLS
ncbi:rSAM/selenodomain-associated transferase 1 [Aquimarina sp. EL_43]|uniref:TIGR04282 family arsenosugar biosynthesis glycosyltransferase n=1 Tax=Aquimarina TaxID=290174 RepID=UPI0004729239|nr:MULTISPECIES: TIGR04282 family arsenosugar biosynthesis glycosyltransferase [Aquimarina]MBG6130438.1 rSAM/selenodomain-associated transferase 1 [Aquimarina sp. EL_35]MBG6149218.1 rSAM/selenodomain-associated transferase 1 [Aquimarina sp. EL_32]MBG6168408.1 rSAM/selenodomain-associated transferase 1 [Aquimarina sp. EL_43]